MGYCLCVFMRSNALRCFAAFALLVLSLQPCLECVSAIGAPAVASTACHDGHPVEAACPASGRVPVLAAVLQGSLGVHAFLAVALTPVRPLSIGAVALDHERLIREPGAFLSALPNSRPLRI